MEEEEAMMKQAIEMSEREEKERLAKVNAQSDLENKAANMSAAELEIQR